MPENLLDYALMGSRPAKLLKSYLWLVLMCLILILAVAFVAAVVVFAITGVRTHLYIALPVTTWLALLALPVLFSVTTRDVRILEAGEDGRYFLNTAKWFKNDRHPFREADALYERGQRVFWLHKTPEGEVKPLDVYDAKVKSPRQNPATPAQIVGIGGYTASVRSYATKKRYTRAEQIRMGLMIGGIFILLIGMYLLAGRLKDDLVDTASEPTPALAQESQVRR